MAYAGLQNRNTPLAPVGKDNLILVLPGPPSKRSQVNRGEGRHVHEKDESTNQSSSEKRRQCSKGPECAQRRVHE